MKKMTFLPDNYIQGMASKIIRKYVHKTSDRDISIPVPIEAILEELYDIIPTAANLNTNGMPGEILGRTTIMSDETISMEIDSSIYPDEVPNQPPCTLARFRFTLAHELAHIVLHIPRELADMRQGSLFEWETPSSGLKPYVSLFRKSDETMSVSRRERKEIQADKMASALLMPEPHILSQWGQLHHEENFGCENVYDEMQTLQLTEPDRLFHYPRCVERMAERFCVSKTAMMYRLKDMQLLDFNRPQPSFF